MEAIEKQSDGSYWTGLSKLLNERSKLLKEIIQISDALFLVTHLNSLQRLPIGEQVEEQVSK